MTDVESKVPEKVDLGSKIVSLDQVIAGEGLDGNAESKISEQPTETSPLEKSETTAKDLAKEEPTERKSISKRVQEGQEYNNRDRKRHDNGGKLNDRKNNDRGPRKEFKDYKQNIKSDMTSKEESSDPVEIRKQVPYLLCSQPGNTDKSTRSNFTSQTLIS